MIERHVLLSHGNYYLTNSLLFLFTTSLLPFLAAISFVGLYVLLGAVLFLVNDLSGMRDGRGGLWSIQSWDQEGGDWLGRLEVFCTIRLHMIPWLTVVCWRKRSNSKAQLSKSLAKRSKAK